MQGRVYAAWRTHADILMAVGYCEKAIAEDREYALAYAGLADAYAALGVRGYIHPLEGRRKSAEAAETAIRLDEGLAEAHAARSLAYSFRTVPISNSSIRSLRAPWRSARAWRWPTIIWASPVPRQGRFADAAGSG